MRPAPLEIEDADGAKFVIDILPLGVIRQIEDFVSSEERRTMGNMAIGMRVLGIAMQSIDSDFDVDKFRLVGGALELGNVVQKIMCHAGMEPTPSGEVQPAQEQTGTTSTDS